MAEEKDFKLFFGVDISELVTGLTEATEAVQESSEAMAESLMKVKEGFSLIAEAAIAVTSIMAGGRVFGEMVEATTKLNFESMELGKQFGISATEASYLKVALNDTFLTQEQLSGGAARITRTLNTNEDAIKNLGVATRDNNGDFRSTLDIMLDVNEKLLEMKEGTDRNVEGTKIYGKGWQQVSDILRLNKEAMSEAKSTAEELNLVVTSDSLESTMKYKTAMVDLKAVFEGVFNTIGQALLPILTSLGNWFKDNGPAAIAATRAAIMTLVEGFLYVREQLKDFVDYVVGNFVALQTQVEYVAKMIYDALHWDWDAVAQDHKIGLEKEKAIYQEYLDSMVRNKKEAADALAAMDEKIFGDKTETKKPTGSETSTGGAAKKETDDRVALLEKLLKIDFDYIDKMREAEMAGYQREEAEAEKNAGMRVAIAEKEVALTIAAFGKESKEYENAQKHLTEVKQKAAEQTQAIADIFTKLETDNQLKAIAEQEKAAQDEFSKHEIDAKQLEQIELRLEDQKTAIARKGIEDRIALLAGDPNYDPKAMAQLQAQLVALIQAHETQVLAIKQKSALQQRALLDQLDKQMESGFSSAIQNMLKGTATFQQGMQQMLKTIMDSIIKMLADWAVQWAATQLKNLITTKTTGVSAVATQAAVAGAAGTASFAEAPWPIDIGAPAFGAAMFASAMGYQAAAAAEGGFDVPAHGVPDSTKLHPKEMVLPAELSEGIRGLIAAGGGGSSGGNTWHVNAVDSRSFEKMLMRNPGQMASALKKMQARAHR